MKLALEVTANAPIDRVWDILGPGYVNAGEWASAVYISHPRVGEAKVAGAPAAGRVCQTSLGPFTESIEEYDPVNHRVAYSATGEKMPGFVKSLVNSWTLTPAGSGRTKVRMELNADIAFPFNVLMGWMMKMQFRGALKDSIEDLKPTPKPANPIPASSRSMAARKPSLPVRPWPDETKRLQAMA